MTQFDVIHLRDTVAAQRERYLVSRKQTAENLLRAADRLESGNYYGEMGKIAGTSLGIAGGAMSTGALGAAVALTTFTGVMAAPFVAVGAALLTMGAVAGGGAGLGMGVNSRLQTDKVTAALEAERWQMERLAVELQKLPKIDGGAFGEASEQKALLEDVHGLGALGVSCSPEEVTKLGQQIDTVLGSDCRGYAAKRAEEVQEKLASMNVPGFSRLTEAGSEIFGHAAELGTSFLQEHGLDQVVGQVGRLVSESVLPVSAFLLPKQIWDVSRAVKKMRKGSYASASRAIREAVGEMEKDTRAVVELQEQLVKSLELGLDIQLGWKCDTDSPRGLESPVVSVPWVLVILPIALVVAFVCWSRMVPS